jgi:CRISP-associated protein Cas1
MQLVLNKYGISLTMEDGMFKVSHPEGTRKIPVNEVKSILMQRSGLISSDAVFTAINNEISIAFINKMGHPVGKVWSHKYGSISTIRKNQVLFSQSADGLRWAISQVLAKMENQAALIMMLGKPDDINENMRSSAIKKIEKRVLQIKSLDNLDHAAVKQSIRGWEGSCSKEYFNCINAHIPEQYRFKQRSQHPAFDMFNSMLNYSYGMLYNKIESALVLAGIDPYTGIMHRDEYNKPVLVYDIIERFRVWADFVVIDLCIQQVIFREFFIIEGQVFFLNTSGKQLLIQSLNDYLDEVVSMNGITRSRNEHINIFTRELASSLKKIKN